MCAPRASASTSSGWAYSRSIRSRTRRRRARSRRRSASPGLVVTTAMVPCPPRTRRSLHRRTRTLRPCRCPDRPGARPPCTPTSTGRYPRAYAHRGWHLGELAGLENTHGRVPPRRRRGLRLPGAGRPRQRGRRRRGAPRPHAGPHHRRHRPARRAAPPPSSPGAGPGRAPVRADPAPGRRARRAARDPGHGRAEVRRGGPARCSTCWPSSTRGDRVCLGRLPRAVAAGGPPARPAPARRCSRRWPQRVVGLRVRGWPGWTLGRAGAAPPLVRPTPPVRGDLAQLPHRFAGVTVVDADVLRVSARGGREVHVWTVDDPAVMARAARPRRRRDPVRPARPAARRARGRGAWPRVRP